MSEYFSRRKQPILAPRPLDKPKTRVLLAGIAQSAHVGNAKRAMEALSRSRCLSHLHVLIAIAEGRYHAPLGFGLKALGAAIGFGAIERRKVAIATLGSSLCSVRRRALGMIDVTSSLRKMVDDPHPEIRMSISVVAALWGYRDATDPEGTLYKFSSDVLSKLSSDPDRRVRTQAEALLRAAFPSQAPERPQVQEFLGSMS